MVLEKKLRLSWPGMIIPSLNSSLLETEDNSAAIEHFINEILSIPELQSTLEVEMFFYTVPDVAEQINLIKTESFEEIADKYEKLYSKISNKDFDSLLTYKKIENLTDQFEKIYYGLKNFEGVLKVANNNYLLDKKAHFSFLKLLTFHENETNKNFLGDKEKFLVLSQSKGELISINKNTENPYEKITSDFEKEENLVYSLIQALYSLEDIYKRSNEIKNHLAVIEKRMKEMVNSKTNWLSYLTLQSPEQEFSQLQNDKLLIEVELSNITRIIKYSFFRLDTYIEQIRINKISNYYQNLKNISEKTINNIMVYQNYWNKVDEGYKNITT